MNAVEKLLDMVDVSTFVAVFAFSRSDFDTGVAHVVVKSVTGNADLFPGSWRETWRYAAEAERWVVVLETLE